MHFNKPLKHSQQGQGMVEYAIMLILLITLVIGGIELAGAALASGKASDAAKAAVNDFATVNQKRLNAQANQEKYLRQIDIILNGAIFAVDGNGEFSESNEPLVANGEEPEFDNYVKFLDSISNDAIAESDPVLLGAYLDEFFDDTGPLYFFDNYNKDTALNPDDSGDIAGDLAEIIDSIDGIIDNNNDGNIDGDDADGDISAEELLYAVQEGEIKQKIINLAPTDAEDTDAGDPDTNDRIVRYKALLLFEELELAILPLDPRPNSAGELPGLSQAIPLLGDHDPDLADFVRPSCDVEAGTYDYGLPDANNDDVPDRELTFDVTIDGVTTTVETSFPAIYLFNPLPIQVDSCVGDDDDRDNQSFISVLVGGYGQPGDTFYEPGLPKLNTSFYGQYVRVCLNAANEYVRCGAANANEEILKPSGKTCFSNVASNTIDSCIADEPPDETSGYYFWGQVNDQGNGRFSWTNDEAPEFRPVFQISCNGVGHQSPELISDDCLDDIGDPDAMANLKTIQVNVRYRHVFESFLTFGMMELADADLAQYFYDPSNLRSPAVSLGSGIAGSELGPKASGRNPTVKQYKDFRGCYEINLETNQTNSCN